MAAFDEPAVTRLFLFLQNGVQHTSGVNGKSKAAEQFAVLNVLKSAVSETSGLAKIELPDGNPFTLFRQWHGDALASNLVLPNALCLSTATKYVGRVFFTR